MREIEVDEAAASLSRIVDEIGDGGEVVLTRRGRPVAKLVTAQRKQTVRLGVAEGQFSVPDDFDAPLPDEVLELFYNGPLFPEPAAPARDDDTNNSGR